MRAHQQCKVTTLGEDKNKNGKRILETVRETQIIGKKERKLNKTKAKLENLQEAIENRWKTSQESGLWKLNLAGTAEPHRMGLLPGKAI
jgi:hypothetical protein